MSICPTTASFLSAFQFVVAFWRCTLICTHPRIVRLLRIQLHMTRLTLLFLTYEAF